MSTIGLIQKTQEIVDQRSRQMSLKLHNSPNLTRPVSELRVGGSDDFDWTPYPRFNQITYATQPAHLPQLRQGMADLAAIMMNVQDIFYDKELQLNFNALMTPADSVFVRLQEWLAEWPDVTRVGKEPIPQILILR